MSRLEPNALIEVRRQWNNWKLARYRFTDVEGFNWDNQSGGINAKANRFYIHAYVMCDAMANGEIAHSCKHGPPPHKVKICITKKGNEAVFQELAALAGPNPNPPRKLKAATAKTGKR